MFKQLLSKAGNILQGKSWNYSETDTAYPTRSSAVNIDQITQDLLFSNNYHMLAKTGYVENVISNRCMRGIAKAVNSIPVTVMVNDREVDPNTRDRFDKSLINMMINPSPDFSWQLMIESVLTHRKIIGRGYIHPVLSEITGEVLSIDFFRPDRVTTQESQGERILSYRYSRGAEHIIFERDDDGYFDLIDWRQFNPLSDITGLGNVVPTALSIDGHTSGMKWNKQQLDNGHRDSGILAINGSDDQSGFLDAEALEGLKEKLQRESSNRYGIKVINAAATYTPVDLTPHEMDFVQSLNAKVIDICTGLDYPPYLLGVASATFNNLSEAKLSLYEDTALPIHCDFYGSLAAFLSRKSGKKVEFVPNLKEVVAMAPRFQIMHEEIRKDWDSDLITRDEAREPIGYELAGGLDGNVYKSDLQQPVSFTQES